MANKSVFAPMTGRLLPRVDAVNRAGGAAYAHDARHALAQAAMTGTFGQLFYSTPEEELARALALAETVEPAFLACTAVHGREAGHMKDMPAVLLAVLSRRDPVLFSHAFRRVVNDGKMLRTFVQEMRSGRTGRKSLGARPKACVADWLNRASDRALLQANVGNAPALADVIRMVHPKPASAERRALYAWILGKPCEARLLPRAVQDWIGFKATGEGPPPDVPFQMLTQAPLSADQWAAIAERASWQMLRMNLNAFLRHGVFERPEAVRRAAETLRDPERSGKAKVLPYQLMVAAKTVSSEMPREIVEALHDAMEIATGAVPAVRGRVAICPDVSGSMSGPVTGWRKGATTAVRCVDVAALVTAALMRRNPQAEVLPFDHRVVDLRLEPRDTILTNAQALAEVGGGGTNLAAPLARLNETGARPDLVVIVSDNQSWMGPMTHGATQAAKEWEMLKTANPRAKLICLDIAPYGTTQVPEREDVLNIGGFSDRVFGQIADFAEGRTGPAHWVGEIEEIEL